MAHTVHDKARLQARVKRIKGQLAALERQLDEGNDCIAVLQQIAAVRGAVNGLMMTVMEGHLIEHIVDQADLQQRRDNSDVVLQVLKSYLK